MIIASTPPGNLNFWEPGSHKQKVQKRCAGFSTWLRRLPENCMFGERELRFGERDPFELRDLRTDINTDALSKRRSTNSCPHQRRTLSH